ncbi:tripartite tricarboxylate transporter TctB family protein [Rhizobium rhizogenes]|uniref:Small permease of tripartite tricarboxylate transporter n=1 Tax=Rhizobium rhizogenes TaxID=359 RepID=A0AA92C1F9_RHIRH|nr:tripartite tricarboxylate transporter TctB family protein [Rhizobium rhizogenes]PVE52259.1 small permease of tripartite tricarboxylate transporter [Rhizobium rhizogenes]PVE62068.1 small permease of tripartite tricarboxylate transporter [Agrobacterium tumefaciens]PVE69850.1 small permease of tripartite tricarboxylate transporter [Sphingomonas sp. TPD3009]
MTLIRGQRDFGIGVIYLALGIAGFLIARSYSFGTAGRMGPGYFPTIISSLLVLFGFVTIGRGLFRDGPPIDGINWKGVGLITLSVCAFGYLLERVGLVLALAMLVLLSAAASERFRFEVRAAVGLVALVIFCAIVFVEGLGLPMPLVGEWIKG